MKLSVAYAVKFDFESALFFNLREYLAFDLYGITLTVVKNHVFPFQFYKITSAGFVLPLLPQITADINTCEYCAFKHSNCSLWFAPLSTSFISWQLGALYVGFFSTHCDMFRIEQESTKLARKGKRVIYNNAFVFILRAIKDGGKFILASYNMHKTLVPCRIKQAEEEQMPKDPRRIHCPLFPNASFHLPRFFSNLFLWTQMTMKADEEPTNFPENRHRGTSVFNLYLLSLFGVFTLHMASFILRCHKVSSPTISLIWLIE